MRARGGIVAALLAALLVCTGCNLLAPPPSALPPLAAPAAAPAAAAPAAAGAPHVGFIGRAFCGLRILIGRIQARLGMRFPGLEGKPPLTAISDPANLESPTPAVKTAAEVKADEDAAPQKIKALRYLAGIGCTECYPDIEKAMRAALDDCTESVRYEAVKAIRKTAGDPCQACLATRCCKPEILKRLREMAYDMREGCCYKEPSSRVRRLARLVLAECNGAVIVEPAEPMEGPSRPPEAAGPAADMQAAALPQNRRVDVTAAPADHGSASIPAASPHPSPSVSYDGSTPTEFRWEQLTAPRNRFESAERARQALAYVRRSALGQPAIRPDDFDPKAVVVRTFDWTRPEQAPSAPIAQALFRLPISQPSDVVEDEAGWHLLLVHQRHPERNQPVGSNTVSAGGWSLDRQPQDYGTAYLDKKLFTEKPPTPGGTATRPTRISRPEANAPDPTAPLTVDRPRRLPGTVALRVLPYLPERAMDAPAETNGETDILRVNGILPVETWHRPRAP